ncbi:hypothetical protein [Erwinia mallotivora]|uniref:Uncharacterized protein n=1 Tax=Erwinia mallotivora TaxID=69222 RepID=A0A014NPM2_9GAMM|nr:hypothetical protein [Erwinia mallotivora]EXU75750.1 hypothetical protein BG55_10935 [Erwinia mallotivora]
MRPAALETLLPDGGGAGPVQPAASPVLSPFNLIFLKRKTLLLLFVVEPVVAFKNPAVESTNAN